MIFNFFPNRVIVATSGIFLEGPNLLKHVMLASNEKLKTTVVQPVITRNVLGVIRDKLILKRNTI